jgi:hypothetical protein
VPLGHTDAAHVNAELYDDDDAAGLPVPAADEDVT